MSHNPEVYAPGVPSKRVAPKPIESNRDPVSSDINYALGQPWVNKTSDVYFVLVDVTAGVATWVNASSLGSVIQLDGDSGSATPAAGVIDVVGASGQLSTSGSSSTLTISLAGSYAPSASVPFQYSEVTLTSAEVKALATTPIELVAAPAAGATNLFHGALLKLNYGGTNAFTESGDNLGIKYTDASGVQVCTTIECTNFIDATADTYINAVPSADALVAATGAEAQALVLDNLGNNFAGNAADDNTLTVRVFYTVQSL